MRFENVESFVGQLVLHRYSCDAPKVKKIEFVEHHVTHRFFGFSCSECDTVWEIDPVMLYDTPFRYIRGGDREVFRSFLANLNCEVYPGGSYADLFLIYRVMSC